MSFFQCYAIAYTIVICTYFQYYRLHNCLPLTLNASKPDCIFGTTKVASKENNAKHLEFDSEKTPSTSCHIDVRRKHKKQINALHQHHHTWFFSSSSQIAFMLFGVLTCRNPKCFAKLEVETTSRTTSSFTEKNNFKTAASSI